MELVLSSITRNLQPLTCVPPLWTTLLLYSSANAKFWPLLLGSAGALRITWLDFPHFSWGFCLARSAPAPALACIWRAIVACSTGYLNRMPSGAAQASSAVLAVLLQPWPACPASAGRRGGITTLAEALR